MMMMMMIKTSVETERIGERISISTIVVDKLDRFNYTEMYFWGYYSHSPAINISF